MTTALDKFLLGNCSLLLAKCIPSWKLVSLMAVATFSRILHPATLQKWFKVLTWRPNSSDFNLIEHLRHVLGNESDP